MAKFTVNLTATHSTTRIATVEVEAATSREAGLRAEEIAKAQGKFRLLVMACMFDHMHYEVHNGSGGVTSWRSDS